MTDGHGLAKSSERVEERAWSVDLLTNQDSSRAALYQAKSGPISLRHLGLCLLYQWFIFFNVIYRQMQMNAIVFQ